MILAKFRAKFRAKPRVKPRSSSLKPLLLAFVGASALSLALAAVLVWTADPAAAQSLSLDLGGDATGGETTARVIQIIALVTVLSLAPSILVMMTSFVRIIVVLSFLRTALGTQQTPPNQVLISLALFLTLFVMMPVFEKTFDQGIKPLIEGEIEEAEAFKRSVQPFRAFMLSHVREQDIALFVDIAKIPDAEVKKEMPMRVLIPAFVISELRRAFEIGFLVFVPFLIIDMVVASVLMSMGMMMLPPIIIALPFKIIFFVLVDGWYMIVGSLVRSFG
ncbi:MAG: flagellar type III secretion system pore protein FliP [Rhodospirillales bacterium]|nr:flagellar type III secretion system pore protein FliP [Alphaproteobacteria bacterium]MBL6947979.1 flagellar type III secretion system pore protein FliP [Rhodospirillales bacterium]